MAETKIKSQAINDRSITDAKIGTTQCAFSAYNSDGGLTNLNIVRVR